MYNYFINLTEENISQEFRLKKIQKVKKYFIKEIDQNELLSNFLRSQFLSRSATREAIRIYQFITNNHSSFHLW